MKKKIIQYIAALAATTGILWLVTLSGALCKLPDGAYIHIGDAALYLASLLLPWHVALPGAALGCMFADLSLGSVNYALATLIIKTITVATVKSLIKVSDKPLTQDILISVAGGICTVCGYYVADIVKALDNTASFFDAMVHACEPIMYNVIQALVCALIFIVIAPLARSIKYKRMKKDEVSE